MTKKMQNPLLEPFDQAPFSKIKNEHYLPAFEKAMADAKEEINTISNLNEAPSFENTVIALEQSGEQLDRISSIFFNLNAAETNPELQQIAQEIAPKLSAFKNDIILNKQLFDRIKRIVDQQPELDEESQMLLEKNYKSFTRNGALLQEEQQQQLRLIDEELSKSSLLFGQHLLADSNAYELLLNDPSDLEGLPEGYIEMSRSAAKEKFRRLVDHPILP
jgi:Zn-dependent oligopeptidase